jgi:nucleoside-diphosphate-sugar epimerase
MNILLTGSNGFLGSHILKTLDFPTYTLNRSKSFFNCNLITDIPSFNIKFDLVIHAAGLAHSNYFSQDDKKILFDTNVTGTINLLKGLSNTQVPRMFVFISSVSVYGLTKGKQINELSPLLATDPYGNSKIQAESIITKWCKENHVLLSILRLPLIVGNNPPGNLGNMIKAIKKGYYFNIANGKEKKSMVLATDIALYIIKIANFGGVYNLTDGVHPTFHQLSNAISNCFNQRKVRNMPLLFAKTLAKIGDIFGPIFPLNSNKLYKITSTLTFDDSKARKSFNWSPNSVLHLIPSIFK